MKNTDNQKKKNKSYGPSKIIDIHINLCEEEYMKAMFPDEKPMAMTSSKIYYSNESNVERVRKKETPEWEIWLGYYHLGQGSHPSSKPQMIDKIKAPTFKVACVMHEHKSSYDSLKKQVDDGTYIGDGGHLGNWYYNPKTNSNLWVGKYYESEEEAWKSFPDS